MSARRPIGGAQPITLHYFLTNLGLFGLLSTLAVTLTATGFSAGQTGFLVLVFTFANKVSKVLLASSLDRFSVPATVLIGCLTAAAGLLAFRFATGFALTAVTLAVAGLGVSINALGSKQLAAAASDHYASRSRVFSMINVAVNVASAIAAPVALFLVGRHDRSWVLAGVAAVYCLAGSTTYLTYARSGAARRDDTVVTSMRTYLDVLALPGMRDFMLINLLGWFCYGQLFNALAVHVADTLHEPSRLGLLYTLNAVLIVVTQLGVTHVAERVTGGRTLITATTAYTLFAVAFVVIVIIPGYAGAVVGVVVFSVAEMLFVPTMDVALLRVLGGHSRVVAYGLFSLGDALGEGVGGGVGVAVYRMLAAHGHASLFWLLAGALAVFAALVTLLLRARNASLREAADLTRLTPATPVAAPAEDA